MQGSEDPAIVPAYERFSFGDAAHVTNEQQRLLRSLDELLARNLTHALSAWLRTGVNAKALPQAQQQFAEFVDRTDGYYLLPLHLPEVHATGLLRWPLALARQMVEMLLGGGGSENNEATELTEIEDAVFSAVLEVAVRELNAVWSEIGLRFEAGERARNGIERQLLATAESIFAFRIEVETGNSQAEISFCIAAPVLASVLRRAAAERRPLRGNATGELGRLMTSMRDARVRAGLCFAPVRMPASALARLQVDRTLVLPLPSNATAELRVSDVIVATAVPLRVGERRAARLSALRQRSEEAEADSAAAQGIAA